MTPNDRGDGHLSARWQREHSPPPPRFQRGNSLFIDSYQCSLSVLKTPCHIPLVMKRGGGRAIRGCRARYYLSPLPLVSNEGIACLLIPINVLIGVENTLPSPPRNETRGRAKRQSELKISEANAESKPAEMHCLSP